MICVFFCCCWGKDLYMRYGMKVLFIAISWYIPGFICHELEQKIHLDILWHCVDRRWTAICESFLHVYRYNTYLRILSETARMIPRAASRRIASDLYMAHQSHKLAPWNCVFEIAHPDGRRGKKDSHKTAVREPLNGGNSSQRKLMQSLQLLLLFCREGNWVWKAQRGPVIALTSARDAGIWQGHHFSHRNLH